MPDTYPITFDETGQKYFETGVSKGVLFPHNGTSYGAGVAWNGLTAVTEQPSGAEATALWADNIKYLNLFSTEVFGATVAAYTYPDEFAECDGSAEIATGVNVGQQPRRMFGLCYRTEKGNDINERLGYILHFIYNAKATPSEKAYNTVNDSPEAINFSWTLSTTPVPVSGKKPTALVTVDSTKVDATKLAMLEAIIYGSGETAPRLPLPDEIASLVGDAIVVDAESGSAVLFGKSVSDLQSNIVVDNSAKAITGTLKYVTGYTEFSGDTELQSGNFIALKFSAPEGATTTVEVVNGISGPVTLDSDMNGVFRIVNKDTQSIRVITTKNGQTIATKTYRLAGVTLNPAG